MPVKFILDTDIGTDVDDAWALALCLASCEIDLVGVTLVYGDLNVRSRIALKLFKLANRTDIPVYKGLAKPLQDGVSVYWAGHEGTNTDFSDINGLSARDGAVDFILDIVRDNPDEVVICSIGPLTNIAEAVRRKPTVMRRVRRIVSMVSSYEGEGHAVREHNGCSDPLATRLVLEFGIPATIIGLNVTKRVSITRGQVGSMASSGLAGYLRAMTEQYFEVIGRDFTYMHDPLAAASVIDPAVVVTKSMAAQVLDDGRVAYKSDTSSWLDVCVDVDEKKFNQLLASRTVSTRRCPD